MAPGHGRSTAIYLASKAVIVLVILLACSSYCFDGAAGETTFTKEQYADALDKCFLYFEGQRSGPLPSTQRNSWRANSGLNDGADNGDELLWGAAWLYRATSSNTYLSYLQKNVGWSYSINEFIWDNKQAGLQILLSKFSLEGVDGLSTYRSQADEFVCKTLPASSERTTAVTPGGLLYVSPDNNMQYVAASSFIIAIHADNLNNHEQTVTCGSDTFQPSDLYTFSKSQMDYILGNNPLGMSFMTGFGSIYPQRVHHRGASIVSYVTDATKVGCSDGYSNWYNKDAPNPNVHMGAIVGGPDSNDAFTDSSNDYEQLEAMTYINAATCPLLATIRATES